LEEVNNLALVPDVVAGGDDIDAEIEKLLGQRWGDAKTGGRVLAIRDDEVDEVILHQRGKLFLHNGAARPPKNIAYKKYAQIMPQEISFEDNTQRGRLWLHEWQVDSIESKSF
jgi:hypothetical protein